MAKSLQSNDDLHVHPGKARVGIGGRSADNNQPQALHFNFSIAAMNSSRTRATVRLAQK